MGLNFCILLCNLCFLVWLFFPFNMVLIETIESGSFQPGFWPSGQWTCDRYRSTQSVWRLRLWGTHGLVRGVDKFYCCHLNYLTIRLLFSVIGFEPWTQQFNHIETDLKFNFLSYCFCRWCPTSLLCIWYVPLILGPHINVLCFVCNSNPEESWPPVGGSSLRLVFSLSFFWNWVWLCSPGWPPFHHPASTSPCAIMTSFVLNQLLEKQV